ncbi:helix-turn-helix domain-containing protein [Bifidobacterium olomucense]|uniref:Helix-turn-helix domain-containing protein n=1 Tax=Bifidobacterium olomucense TaxID=2675324 RepID=A0A7Y0HY94_9BIFI|nr:helix-turn-helix domain-containing protein [Bifidobacterium sp. DSM 109959]NMM98869.1 hypothetical protein [Bifidobacterium sp. DSM 109959]
MPKNKRVPKLLASKYEAAEMLGVSSVTVERMTANGVLPVVLMPSTGKVGRPRNMYAIADLERFIAEHTVTKETPNATDRGKSSRKNTRRRSAVATLQEMGVCDEA